MSTNEAARFDATALTRLRRVSSVAPSPCGRHLAVAVSRLDGDEAKYISDLWRVSLVDDGEPIQLTRGPSNDTSPAYRADGALGFASNRNPRDGDAEAGDDKRSQVWLLPAAGGEPTPLTDEPLGVSEFRFARTGDRLFVIAGVLPGVAQADQRARAAEIADKGPTGLSFDRMPVRHWDHWLPRAAPHLIAYVDGQRRDLTPNADREHRDVDFGVGWDVSDDGSRVAITKHRGAGSDLIPDVSLLVLDVDAGTSIELGATDLSNHDTPRLSPDGARVACTRTVRTHGEAIHPRLWVYDANGGDGRMIAEWDTWPNLCGWTRDGAAVIATADVRGHVPVFRVDVDTGEVARITSSGSGGTHAGLHVTADGAAIVGVRSRLLHPPEPFRVALTPGAEPELVARLSGFGDTEIARWDSFEVAADDGAMVHAMMVEAADANDPLPLLLWIHGGPMGQWSDGWHWRWNPLIPAAAGYAVLLPNPRGSTGYGQKFLAEIWNNEWGGACYTDLMAVTDAACARDDVDATRTAAMGGSFGGYMANWIGGNTDRFACLVTHAGLYHFEAFFGATDYPAYFAQELATTPDHAAEFNRHSPHTRLANWRTPTLIVHGEKDYRVPIGEALLLFEGLQRKGVPSQLLVFPDENHWILRPRNARQWYRTCLDFIGGHLSAPRPESTAG